MKVLFVCTGNICRSPLAEALLRQMLKQKNVEGIEVASAGTAAATGEGASEGGYLVGLECGLDMSGHKAQPLTKELVEEADLILCMSPHHVLRARALGAGDKAHLLGEFAGREADDAEVPDPFGGDLEDYRVTYRTFAELLPAVVDRLVGGRSAPGSGS